MPVLNAQAIALAQDVIGAKKWWQESTTQSERDKAHAQAVSAREKLRSLGFGDLANTLEANDTLESALSAFNFLTAPTVTAPNVAPVAGGTPREELRLSPGTSVTTNNTTVAGPTAAAQAGGLAGAVSNVANNLLGGLNTGIKAGAEGTGAAAGSLAQTATTVIGAVVKVLLPVLVIWGAVKVFRINWKGGN